MENETNKKPIKTFRLSGIAVSVFANERKNKEGQTFTKFSISPKRVYVKDGETKYFTKIYATRIISLPSGGGNTAAADTSSNDAPISGTEDDEDDDLPF